MWYYYVIERIYFKRNTDLMQTTHATGNAMMYETITDCPNIIKWLLQKYLLKNYCLVSRFTISFFVCDEQSMYVYTCM